MYFVFFKLFRFGVSQVKKRKANKTQDQNPPQNDPTFNPQTQQGNMRVPSSYYTGSGAGARNPIKVLIESALRFFQFVFGLTVIGLYGQDVKHDASVHAKCVYAVVTGFLGTITALIHLLLPFVLKERPLAVRPRCHLPLFVWEFVLFVLWLTLFGIFGKMYIGNYSTVDEGRVTRMRHAVWVDLTSLCLCVATALWAGVRWWKSRNGVVSAGKGEGDVEKDLSVEG